MIWSSKKERLYSLGNVVEVTDDTRPCYDLKAEKTAGGDAGGRIYPKF